MSLSIFRSFFLLRFLILLCFLSGNVELKPQWALKFELTTSAVAFVKSGYGQQCDQCIAHLSKGYCAKICCESCQELDKQKGGYGAQCFNSICGDSFNPSTNDLTNVSRCLSSNFEAPGCENIKDFVDDEQILDFSKLITRRSNSCQESVIQTETYCSLDKLTQSFPNDIFEKARSIKNANECELVDQSQNSLSYSNEKLENVTVSCQTSFKNCKLFCFDNNVVTFKVNGRNLTYENDQSQKDYEQICKSQYEFFIEQKNSNLDLIHKAQDKLNDCEIGFSNESRDLDRNSEIASSKESEGEDEDGEERSNKTTPQAILNQLNQVNSAIQPFLNSGSTNGGYRPNLYVNGEVASGGFSGNNNSGLSYEDMYGPAYEGSNSGGSDTDFGPDSDFDKPKSLFNNVGQNQNNRSAGNGFQGGMLGAMGGGFGNGSSPGSSNPNSGAKMGPRRTGQKDKTLFGKLKNDMSGNASVGLNDDRTDPRLKSKNASSKNDDKNSTESKSQKAVFNPSKYHAQIMASFDNGENSRAYQIAKRRAAGLVVETFEEKRKKGYTSWHKDHGLHPEGISLFLQTKICYHTKFRSDFRESCEF